MPVLALALLPFLSQVPVVPGDVLTALADSIAQREFREAVPVEGQPFDRALRLRTVTKPRNEWDLRARVNINAAVAAGDVLLATVWIRKVEPADGPAFTRIVFEKNADPYPKSLDQAIVATADWRQYRLGFRLTESFAPGQASLHIWMGYEPQVIEVAGVSLVNLGREGEIPPVTYFGRESDAAWRAAAAERIDRYRKADLSVEVVDSTGKPVPGAVVRIRQQRHAFEFGTCVASAGLVGTSANDERYRQTLKSMFNAVVIENDLKWPNWERNRQLALDGLRWLRENEFPVRGHNLVWPSWKWLPADLPSLKDDPEAMRKRINEHIKEIVSATRGQLLDWDVINETRANHDLMDILGMNEMVRWFEIAHEFDAAPRLYLNEYDITEAGGWRLSSMATFEEHLRFLKDNGAPIHGLGMQSHFNNSLTPPDRVYEILDRFAALGLDIKITEFDINTTDEPVQADYTRDYLTICFSHPAVKGFYKWGFWEGRHWRPNAAMFRRDWSEKPNAHAWRDLIYKDWWTNADGATGDEGKYAVRAFQGKHDIAVEHGGKVREQTVTLPAEGTQVRVVLE